MADRIADLVADLFEYFNEVFGSREISDADIARFWAPDASLTTRFAALEGRSYRGFDGLRNFVTEANDQFERFDVTLERVVGDGDVRVAVYVASALTRDAGVPIEQRLGMLLEFGDGRVGRARVFADPREALAAAGLDDDA